MFFLPCSWRMQRRLLVVNHSSPSCIERKSIGSQVLTALNRRNIRLQRLLRGLLSLNLFWKLLGKQRKTEAHVSAWVLLGGILLVENEVLKEFSRWFVKSAEWAWKFVQPLVCSHLTRLDNSKKRNFLFSFPLFLSDSNGDSGLTAYNHNLDTSREFYPNVRLPLSTSIDNGFIFR